MPHGDHAPHGEPMRSAAPPSTITFQNQKPSPIVTTKSNSKRKSSRRPNSSATHKRDTHTKTRLRRHQGPGTVVVGAVPDRRSPKREESRARHSQKSRIARAAFGPWLWAPVWTSPVDAASCGRSVLGSQCGRATVRIPTQMNPDRPHKLYAVHQAGATARRCFDEPRKSITSTNLVVP